MEQKPQNIQQRPIVGIGVMLFKDGKILLGKRKGSHGSGLYAWPGGKLDLMESIFDCAKREVKEETGLEITDLKFLRVMNLKTPDNYHFLDIAVSAQWKSGEPQTLEPEKCEGWAWYDINNLPEPLFSAEPSAIEAYKTGKNFFDS